MDGGEGGFGSDDDEGGGGGGSRRGGGVDVEDAKHPVELARLVKSSNTAMD
jgi:hypothetical protein